MSILICALYFLIVVFFIGMLATLDGDHATLCIFAAIFWPVSIVASLFCGVVFVVVRVGSRVGEWLSDKLDDMEERCE